MTFDFEPYIEKIKTPRYKELFRTIVLELPEYWFTASASSSGKYHSKQDVGEYGLLRHSIKVYKIMCYLTELECVKEDISKDLEKCDHQFYLDEAIDLLRIAAMFHDGVKYGLETNSLEHTEHAHPVMMGVFLTRLCEKHKKFIPEFMFLSQIISTHHGQWNTSNYDSTILPRPKDYLQKLLHQCDYLGSRKDIFMKLPELEDDGYAE